MTKPRIVLSVIDPGALARPKDNSQKPIYVGICESGPIDVVQEHAREEDLLSACGAGHLTDVAQCALQKGESVKVLRRTRVSAGTFEADSTDEALTTTSLTGTPLQFLKGRLVITAGGALISSGNCKAKLSLDNWDIPFVEASYSDEFAVATTGIVTLPGTGGLAIHLDTTQTPAVGDDYNFTVTPGHYDSTGVADCLDPLLDPTSGDFTFLCFTGEAQSCAGAATIAAAVISLKTSFYTRGLFYPMLCGGGLGLDTEFVTAFNSVTTDPPFVSAGFEAGYYQSPRATKTRGRFRLSEHEIAAIRITEIAVSTDPGRTASGSIEEVKGVTYDAALEGDLVHDARGSVLRSWHPEAKGYFITRQRMLCDSDSNFESWQFAAVMCVALRAVQRALFRFQLESLRRTATSTLDPRDAVDVKTECEKEIDLDLTNKENVRGIKGHISARNVTVSLTTVLPSLKVVVSLRPLGYPSDISATLEYGNAE